MPDLHTRHNPHLLQRLPLHSPSLWKFKFRDDLSHGLLPLFQTFHHFHLNIEPLPFRCQTAVIRKWHQRQRCFWHIWMGRGLQLRDSRSHKRYFPFLCDLFTTDCTASIGRPDRDSIKPDNVIYAQPLKSCSRWCQDAQSSTLVLDGNTHCWLTNWLSDWLFDWLTNWLTDWLTNWLSDFLTD